MANVDIIECPYSSQLLLGADEMEVLIRSLGIIGAEISTEIKSPGKRNIRMAVKIRQLNEGFWVSQVFTPKRTYVMGAGIEKEGELVLAMFNATEIINYIIVFAQALKKYSQV